MKRVKFYFHDSKVTFRNREKLKLFIEDLFSKEKKSLKSLVYIFCSDEYLLGINIEFLKHDFYTDVITFDLSSSGNQIDGEVYISIDRVKDNAIKTSSLLNEELHRIIFHGALHLCGYKDKNPSDVLKMRSLEDSYLKRYFI